MISNNQELVEALRNNLEKNILSYWIENTLDENHGGFVGHIHSNNEVLKTAEKGAILNSRILWTFSMAAQTLQNEKYPETAHRAYQYIKDFFIDKTYGGIFWSVDYKGNPTERKKQIYAQSFAIYGLAEYYKLTKKQEALQLAVDIYRLIESHSFDPVYDGYIEAFTEDWKDLEDVRLSPKEINSKKTMNTHLHIMEAFTNLYRVWPDRMLYYSLKNLIRVFIQYFIKNSFHLQLFFDEKWNPLDRIVSFGHDIECSWLLAEAAEILGDKSLISETRKIAVKMTDACEPGFTADGGLMYEIEEDGKPDTDKHWWPQAEALVGLVNTFQITNNEKYIRKTYKMWDFIDSHLVDKNHGEWFYKVNQEGHPSPENEKVGFWKCPYHNSRACFEVISRLRDRK
jgi:cellobiose epimerase